MNNRKDLANGVIAQNATNTTTTLYLEVGYGQTMPTVPFLLTLTPPGQLSTMGNSEIVKVTARVDDQLTVERAQKGTTARAISAGWVAANAVYTGDLELYAVGDIFITTRSGNPSALLGYGTWAMFAPGRALVGLSDTGTFNEMNKEVGSETHTLTTGQLPTHSFRLTIHGQENGTNIAATSVSGGTMTGTTYNGKYQTTNQQVGSSSVQNPGASWGAGESHNNIQPSKTVAMWLRTA